MVVLGICGLYLAAAASVLLARPPLDGSLTVPPAVPVAAVPVVAVQAGT